MKVLYTVIFCIALALAYGDEENGLPSYQERLYHAIINHARTGPKEWITKYQQGFVYDFSTILTPEYYPPKTPLYYAYGLNLAAHNYTKILMSGPCFGYSCYEPVSIYTRIQWDYECSVTNTAAASGGYDNAMYDLDYLLCAHVGANCSADTDVAHHSHRDTILDFANVNYTVIGTGYGYNETSAYKYYWFFYVSKEMCAKENYKVYSGSHFFPNTSTTIFIASFKDIDAPSSASVYIDGTKHALSVDTGDELMGTWGLNTEPATKCREYYFEFVDSSNKVWRYPENGNLFTYGEGECTSNYESLNPDASASAFLGITLIYTIAAVVVAFMLQ